MSKPVRTAVGGSVGPVADDEAFAEESESLSPPVVDGPYFDCPQAKRLKLDHLLIFAEAFCAGIRRRATDDQRKHLVLSVQACPC